MKTKLRILLLAGVFLFATKAQAEIKTVIVNNENKKATIEIKDGYVGKCLFASLYKPGTSRNYSNRSSYIRVVKDSKTVELIATEEANEKTRIGCNQNSGSRTRRLR